MNDVLIRRAVEDELAWEPSFDAAGVGVAVNEGIVTLSGHVASYAAKMAAEEATKRVKAVRGVIDNLEVRYAAVTDSDEEIAKRVANLLDWDATLPKNAVKVAVKQGYVTLSGTVPWQYQRVSAELGLRRLHGVRGVSNLIKVKPQITAFDVKRRIEQALDRQADVDAAGIRVTVDGDKIKLDGKVKAWFERDAIERAAWATPGVREVEDHVHIAW